MRKGLIVCDMEGSIDGAILFNEVVWSTSVSEEGLGANGTADRSSSSCSEDRSTESGAVIDCCP